MDHYHFYSGVTQHFCFCREPRKSAGSGWYVKRIYFADRIVYYVVGGLSWQYFANISASAYTHCFWDIGCLGNRCNEPIYDYQYMISEDKSQQEHTVIAVFPD